MREIKMTILFDGIYHTDVVQLVLQNENNVQQIII